MKTAQVLFELSGEHPSLPAAEVRGMLRAESPDSSIEIHPGVVISGPVDEGRAAARLALTHRIGSFLGACGLDEVESFASTLELPDGTLAVRGRGFEGTCLGTDVDAVVKKVAAIVAKDRKVDLRHPEVELRFVISDKVYFHVKLAEIDRPSFDRRKVAERPFFSPISLHPRYARALVNIAGVREGDLVLDPFCGTGGTLIEAALIGAKACGSDIDEEMIAGTAANMDHLGIKAERLEVLDIDDAASEFPEMHAVLTDLPYGRSASTRKEGVPKLYSRAVPAMHACLREGGSFGIVAPLIMELAPLHIRETHAQRVHRSLTRYYHFGIRER
jgi:tRNA (guanine10-N2)-dimethyltransferase